MREGLPLNREGAVIEQFVVDDVEEREEEVIKVRNEGLSVQVCCPMAFNVSGSSNNRCKAFH